MSDESIFAAALRKTPGPERRAFLENGRNGVLRRHCRSRRLQFAPKKISVSCRFASAPFDNIAVPAKHQPRKMDMRFISIKGTWEGTWETYQLFEMPTEEGQ